MTDPSELSLAGDRLTVSGNLCFATVTSLFTRSRLMLEAQLPKVIDLSGIGDADSAGLALLLEWASWAKQRKSPLEFVGMPSQLLRLARLSDADKLLKV